MARKYHTLLTKDAPTDPWAIAFGDYDLWSVEEERDDHVGRGWKRSQLKIITTGSRQRDIDAAVAALNEASK
ncbi:MAG: hypothetical protein EOR00_09605 [Mesorhizobium sp.]|nr:MAG: hypothetical protein EOR00_09605 [Mesorhizobium sp.]